MHLTAKQLSEYANRTLNPTELLLVDDHLAGCADCCKNLSSVLQANTGGNEAVSSIVWELTAAAEDFHLSFTQIAGYVDQQLDPGAQGLVSDHLQVCQTCRAETVDLQAFKQTLPAPLSVTSKPPAAGVLKWGDAIRNFRPSAWWLLPAAAAAGMVIFAIGFFGQSKQEAVALQQPAPPPTIAPPAKLDPPQSAASPLPTPDKSPAAQSAEERAVQMALATGRVEIPAEIKGLRAKGGNLMSGESGASTFTILAPQGVMVESDQPRLRWLALPRASNYVVTVTDQHFNEVARSPALTATNWSVPVQLKRGELYQWQVTATTGDGKELTAPATSAPEAKFKVLSAEAFSVVRLARQRYGPSHLELGVIYARVGLLQEAEREFKLAGNQSPIARRLLKHLRQQLG